MAASTSSKVPTRENEVPERPHPKMTVATTAEYAEKMAVALSYAMLPNPTWRLFFGEGEDGISNDASDEVRLQGYTSMLNDYTSSALKSGAFIAEAGDFSAYALWLPPGSHKPAKTAHDFDAMERRGQVVSTAFAREVEKTKTELIRSVYQQEFWQLVLLGRDPRKGNVSGAVTAVLRPFVDQAITDNKPIWLETTSEHARDIYLHFGWRIVRTITISGYNEWCMVLYPPMLSSTLNKISES